MKTIYIICLKILLPINLGFQKKIEETADGTPTIGSYEKLT